MVWFLAISTNEQIDYAIRYRLSGQTSSEAVVRLMRCSCIAPPWHGTRRRQVGDDWRQALGQV